MLKGFAKANIYVENQGIVQKSILFEKGKIKAIGDFSDPDLLTLCNDLIIIPGFINKHVHGLNHSDCMYPTYEDIANIASSLLQEGVTSFLVTTMTQAIAKIEAALDNIRRYMENPTKGAHVLGVHLEGPFISKHMKSAQPEEYVIPCNVDICKKLQEISGNNILQVTFAYEENGKTFLKYLVENGIVASLGHTWATCDEVLEAAALGATSATHTFNAMRGFHHREAGTVGGVLLAGNINCELICDLFHVSENAIRLLFKCKGKDNISLVTDSIEAAHLPDGKYLLGGQDVFVTNSEARLADGTIAGSTLRMNVGVKNIMKVLNLSIEDAIDLATINPARVLNIDKHTGSIKPGKAADGVIIDRELNVYATIVNGELLYVRNCPEMEHVK